MNLQWNKTKPTIKSNHNLTINTKFSYSSDKNEIPKYIILST